jgi:hypothetical protein
MKKIKTLGLLLLLFIAPQVKGQGLSCDDFTDATEWPEVEILGGDITEGDTIGFSQGGTQLISFGFQADAYSDFHIYTDLGMLNAGLTIDFAFDGTNQVAIFHIGENNILGTGNRQFSVNGSDYTLISDDFPMVIDGITVDIEAELDTEFDFYEYYLKFYGDLNEVSFRAPSSYGCNIMALCVTSLFEEDDCDDFTDLVAWPTDTYVSEELLGYSQGGTQTITSGASSYGDVNDVLEDLPGIFGVGPVDFSFDDADQVARFLMYGFDYQLDEMGFSVNGSSTVYLDSIFPLTISDVLVSLDLSPPNVGDWEYFYLTFSGEIDQISQILFESSVTELCVDLLDSAGYANVATESPTSFNLYPNPTTNLTTIVANTPLNNLQIFTLSGQLISTVTGISSTQTQIDVSHLESGIYIVKVILEDGTHAVQKLIKE